MLLGSQGESGSQFHDYERFAGVRRYEKYKVLSVPISAFLYYRWVGNGKLNKWFPSRLVTQVSHRLNMCFGLSGDYC